MMSAVRLRGKAAPISAVSTALLVGTLLVQGCAPQPVVVAGSTTPVYGIDLAGGAKRCGVPADVGLADKKEAPLAMTVGNDGGWCAISVGLPGPKPYRLGLVVARPQHGHVFVHTVGDLTRIDYTPDKAFAGNDSFSVKLEPGDQVIRTTVAVGPT